MNNNNNNNNNDKTWTWLRNGNFKRGTESRLITAQNNTVRTNHIKARIDKTQQNSKCRLCGNRDETINHIMSECSKLAQKEYKTTQDLVGKVIHWEMRTKFKFDHTNKWYMLNPAPVLENNTHNLLWDFDLHTDHRRPVLENNTHKLLWDFDLHTDHRRPVLENNTHKLLWDFDLHTDHQKTRPNNNQQKKEDLQNSRLCCPG